MIASTRLATAVVLALAAMILPAEALDRGQVFDLGEKALADASWADWMRRIFIDLTLEPQAQPGQHGYPRYVSHGKVSARPIDGDSFGDGDCKDDSIEYIDYETISVSGQMRIVAGITMRNQCIAPLALFDIHGKLLDLVDVQKDRTTSFGEKFVTRLSEDSQLVEVANFHTGAGAGGDQVMLILATKDKFSAITSFGGDYETTCDDHTHVYRGYNSSMTVDVAPDYGDHERIITYTKTTFLRYKDDCQTLLGNPVIKIDETVWRWNSAKHAYQAAWSGKISP